MKAYLLTFLLLLGVFFSFGQIKYEKGYFIDNNNQRIECLIKNYDWKSNPKEIEYKTSESSGKQRAGISSIKEFGIAGDSKFVRVKTDIDRSSADISRLSNQKKPEWSNEEIFLKVLIAGKASLFYYEENSLQRFFFSVSDTQIRQLIYKEYLTAEKTIAINSEFRQQLWIYLRCSNTSMNAVGSLSYEVNALKKYFKKYNDCTGNSFVEFSKRNKGDLFTLRIVPGINSNAVSIGNNVSSFKNTDFKNTIGFRIGMEAEVILPFNKNKWGLLFEPTYQYLNSTGPNKMGTATLTYSSIEFLLGVRYKLFLKQNLILYFNGFYIPSYSADFHSTIEFDYPYATNLDIKSTGSLAIGAGIALKKLSAEVRYSSKREILSNYLTWQSEYQRLSLLIGYRLYGKN